MKTFCVLILLLAGVVVAQDVPVGEYDEVAKAIQNKIFENDKVKIDQFKILHKDGAVYLEGIADYFGSYYYAGKIASDYSGIKAVENQIVVRAKDIPDEEIQANLFQKVRRHMRPEPFDLISIKVTRGFVTLMGVVRDKPLKEEVFKEAIWLKGVRSVENKIEYASLAVSDERLRLAIYRRLASDYPQYFTGPHSSIIILVEHGRVTLVGNINSESEKLRILSTIRSFLGVLSVIDQLETS